MMKRPKQITAMIAGVLLLAGGLAQAGQFTWTFETDPTTGPFPLELAGNNVNPREWHDTGGNPGGFLALTYPVEGQYSVALFPDIDNGALITAFELECDIRSGNSTGDRAADGWSVSLARTGDPVLANPGNMGTFAGTAAENGTTTGIAIAFDTWAGNALPDGPDLEGIIVRVDNRTILRHAMPTRHGDCDDPTSLQTGPRDPDFWAANNVPAGGADPQSGIVEDPESWATLCWQKLRVVVDNEARVTVSWKGVNVLENFQTDFFPSPGRIVLAGRTGGANSHVHFDNVKLTTTVQGEDTEPPTTPTNFTTTHVGAGSVGLTWGASTDDSGRVAYELERDGTAIGGTITTTSFVDRTAPGRGVSPNTTYNYRVRATDVAGNRSDWVTLAATTVADQAAAGGVRGELFDNLSGVLVYEGFVLSGRFDSPPDRYAYLSGLSFGEWTGFGDTYGDNYAFRVTGILTPPVTGQYRFFVRSDDGSEFHLNRTGTTPPDPMQDFADAVEAGCCRAFQEPGEGANTQPGYEGTFPTSEPISLVAGQQYGFLWMVKEGGGGDWGQVAWRIEGDTTPAASLQPIPGRFVSGSRVDPIGTTISIAGPEDVTAVENQVVTLTAQVNYQSPYPSSPWYQWQKNGQPIIGASGAAYQFTATAADNGANYSVQVGAFGLVETSREMTLTIVADTFPPVPSAGALVSRDGTTVDIGVGFDEPVTDATASVQANYSVSSGTVQSFTYYPLSQSALIKVTGLAPGASGTVTVRNVSDTRGNAIPAAGVQAAFRVSENLRWDVVGGAEGPGGIAGNYVVPVGEDAFDVFSNGVSQWATYDEATFVYEEIEGDFDKRVRVEFQELSSQWARAGIIVREVTNFNVDRDAQTAGGQAGRYQKVHVNPQGPTLTGPGTPGNNTWEGNRRTTVGGATDSAGGGGTPQYPDAWCRIRREGSTVTIYRSDDGSNWVQLGQTLFEPPLPGKVYVGPDYSPELGNITNEADRRTFLAKFRDYGDTFAIGVPELGAAVQANGDIVITFQGVLQQREVAGGDWTNSGLSSPATIAPAGSGRLYRAVQ